MDMDPPITSHTTDKPCKLGQTVHPTLSLDCTVSPRGKQASRTCRAPVLSIFCKFTPKLVIENSCDTSKALATYLVTSTYISNAFAGRTRGVLANFYSTIFMELDPPPPPPLYTSKECKLLYTLAGPRTAVMYSYPSSLRVLRHLGGFSPTPFICGAKPPKQVLRHIFHYVDKHSSLLRNTYIISALAIKALFNLYTSSSLYIHIQN